MEQWQVLFRITGPTIKEVPESLSPLRMIRFAGHSPIERIATEILGLSKMDWNSYDLYSQMPATLESSGAIARIGQLLSRFGPETYDYRLFI
jgi:hypothetical protein